MVERLEQAGSPFDRLRQEVVDDRANAWAAELGYAPLFTASRSSKIAVIGQAPGRRAQMSGVPWDDPSGVKLRNWLGVTDAEFYDPGKIALVPMDFFYPGKGGHGDLPPRKDFAPRWHPRIFEEIDELRLTVLVGAYAQRFYLDMPRSTSLTATVRAYEDYLPSRVPVVHPSPLNFRWHTKNPWFEEEVIPELQRLVREALT